jgi:hypothetical protein
MKLTVNVRETKQKGQTGFEGVASVPGLSQAKVARVKDGGTLFTNVSALRSAANALGQRLGATVDFVEPTKKAAKKSVKAKTVTSKTKRTSSK